MIFPGAEKFSTSLPWVQEFCAEIGMNIEGLRTVNLPRHPSPLYEAFFEGIFLWSIIWSFRKHKFFDGQIGIEYTFGYGFVRFIIEYFREPDAEIGYRIAKDSTAPIYTNSSLLNFSTGQVFCFTMMAGALITAVILYILSRRKQKK